MNDSLIPGGWVLLSYRMPRNPSSPRVAVWRRLQALGVAQLGDGLVALPADARTREHFDWIAGEVTENGGTATVWTGQPVSKNRERAIAEAMTEERRQEYLSLVEEAHRAASLEENARERAANRLKAQLRKISRRDYFPPAERDTASHAVTAILRPGTAVAADPGGAVAGNVPAGRGAR